MSEAMPNAVMSGHAMSPTDPDIQEIFNAISIGFTTVDMIEGKKSFESGWQEYLNWMTLPKPLPHTTMVESAVRLQLGYGYGFDSQLAPKNQGQLGFIPRETYQFSAHEYRYMRFGLAFTLMRDGFFAHELGDSWHGQVRFAEEGCAITTLASFEQLRLYFCAPAQSLYSCFSKEIPACCKNQPHCRAGLGYDELEWNMPSASEASLPEKSLAVQPLPSFAANFSIWGRHDAGVQATIPFRDDEALPGIKLGRRLTSATWAATLTA